MAGSNQRWWPAFVFLAALWGASFLFMRLAVVEFGVLPTAALRGLIGLLTLLPIMVWQGQIGALAARWPRVFIAGILNSGIPSAALSYSLLSLTTGVTSVVFATVPLFGALIAWSWLGHRPGALVSLGLMGGLAGVAALTWDSIGFRDGASGWSNALAVLAAAAGAASGAFSALYSRRHLQGMPVLAVAAGTQVGATLALAIPALLTWPEAMPGAKAWLGITALGLLCTGLGTLLFFWLIQRAGPTRAVAVTFLMPLFAMAYGVALLGETVSIRMALCAVVIIGSTAAATRVPQA